MKAMKALSEIISYPLEKKQVVVHSEMAYYWLDFSGIVKELLARGFSVCYLAASNKDEGLNFQHENFKAWFIGAGNISKVILNSLEATLMLTTTPHIGRYPFKRSPLVKHYCYLFHAPTSLHFYRRKALDNYDSVLAVGPHHVAEIRELEKKRGSKVKLIGEHGYARLDVLRAMPRLKAEEKNILVAPSWGKNSLMAHNISQWIQGLLDAGYKVTFRPHPQCRKSHKFMLLAIKSRFGSRIVWDNAPSLYASMENSAALLTDSFSGIFMDYAFIYDKPIITVTLPVSSWRKKKIEYSDLTSEPLEFKLRKNLTICVERGDYGSIGEISNNTASLSGERQELMQQNIYNIGSTAEKGANFISEILTSLD